MRNVWNIGLLALLWLSTGCTKIYQSTDAPRVAAEHRRIAILPPTVTLQGRVKLTDSAKPTAELEAETGRELQRALFTWMLERQMDGEFATVAVQDPQSTNAQLRQLGYFENKDLSNAWLAEMLKVDAVITADFRLDYILRSEVATAINILTDAPLPARQGNVWLKLYDGTEDRIIWSYDRRLSRRYGQRPESIINGVMRHASRKMPYRVAS